MDPAVETQTERDVLDNLLTDGRGIRRIIFSNTYNVSHNTEEDDLGFSGHSTCDESAAENFTDFDNIYTSQNEIPAKYISGMGMPLTPEERATLRAAMSKSPKELPRCSEQSATIPAISTSLSSVSDTLNTSDEESQSEASEGEWSDDKLFGTFLAPELVPVNYRTLFKTSKYNYLARAPSLDGAKILCEDLDLEFDSDLESHSDLESDSDSPKAKLFSLIPACDNYAFDCFDILGEEGVSIDHISGMESTSVDDKKWVDTLTETFSCKFVDTASSAYLAYLQNDHGDEVSVRVPEAFEPEEPTATVQECEKGDTDNQEQVKEAGLLDEQAGAGSASPQNANPPQAWAEQNRVVKAQRGFDASVL